MFARTVVWNITTFPEYSSGPIYKAMKDTKYEMCPKQKRHVVLVILLHGHTFQVFL